MRKNDKKEEAGLFLAAMADGFLTAHFGLLSLRR
jgi:hypothetical protein